MHEVTMHQVTSVLGRLRPSDRQKVAEQTHSRNVAPRDVRRHLEIIRGVVIHAQQQPMGEFMKHRVAPGVEDIDRLIGTPYRKTKDHDRIVAAKPATKFVASDSAIEAMNQKFEDYHKMAEDYCAIRHAIDEMLHSLDNSFDFY